MGDILRVGCCPAARAMVAPFGRGEPCPRDELRRGRECAHAHSYDERDPRIEDRGVHPLGPAEGGPGVVAGGDEWRRGECWGQNRVVHRPTPVTHFHCRVTYGIVVRSLTQVESSWHFRNARMRRPAARVQIGMKPNSRQRGREGSVRQWPSRTRDQRARLRSCCIANVRAIHAVDFRPVEEAGHDHCSDDGNTGREWYDGAA